MTNIDDFNCDRCRWGKHCDQSNPAKGNIFEIKLRSERIQQNTCFLPEVTKDATYFINLHLEYEKGILYKEGGASNQPAPYMQAMRHIKWLKMQE